MTMTKHRKLMAATATLMLMLLCCTQHVGAQQSDNYRLSLIHI